MRLILSDNDSYLRFAPLSLTRPIAELRLGLFTISERWQKLTQNECSISYESANPALRYSNYSASDETSILINAAVLPTAELVAEVSALNIGEQIEHEGLWVAKRGRVETIKSAQSKPLAVIANRWDLYVLNDQVLRADFAFISKNRTSVHLPASNTLIGDTRNLFIEEGVRIEACILNCEAGPIYLAKDSEVMEGSIIRGPFALGEHATIKMGAKIYGATSIGPHCKVGGEVSNSIFLAYANKGHDGFIGNAYIGAWCNLGADTNCSNLKNNYGQVKTYCYETQKMVQTDQTFMGLFMGDHSKCAINTMFNTATTVGVCANIFSSGFPEKHIPSFTWGPNLEHFDLDKAYEVASAMMQRRGLVLSEEEKAVLRFWSQNKI
jgi:UDP-N-acetylglucosamine diphosphorylase/glucosamine-1-phosphate N-acetyltransferase